MDIGMNLPVMATGLDGPTLLAWCRKIDEGPWSSLALGERVTFDNPDIVAMLGAAAAATSRVRLVANIAVVPMHHPTLLAKQYATIDQLSGGRLTLGVGVGGREEDYLALGATWAGSRIERMAETVAQIRRLWDGELTHEAALLPLGPRPVQAHVPVLVGALGPKSIARAAQWADGLLGFSFGLDAVELGAAFFQAQFAWEEADRNDAPRLVTGTWCALGPDPDAQMTGYLRRYLNFAGEFAEHLIPLATIRGPEALAAGLQRARDAGADEVLLTPTTSDIGELDAMAEVAFG